MGLIYYMISLQQERVVIAKDECVKQYQEIEEYLSYVIIAT